MRPTKWNSCRKSIADCSFVLNYTTHHPKSKGTDLLQAITLQLFQLFEGDFTRGRQVYAANCTACHHVDPTLDGTMGPAIAGSSRELLVARVLGGDYPSGYQSLTRRR